jgi:hypothetical protein
MAPARRFALRRLTPGERELACEVFGEALDAARVRLLAVPLWRRAFVAGPSLIVWPAAALPADFVAAALPLQGTLVHELAHVWQAQHGVRLLLAKIKAGDSSAAYAYDLNRGCDFMRLNIEQQAMVVEHAFLAARGQPAPHPAELYAQISAAWRGDLRYPCRD